MNYLGNAFSLQMLSNTTASVSVTPIEKEDIPVICLSVLGHQDIADFLGYPVNRATLILGESDTLYVAQFVGGRLPEGVSALTADQMGMIQYFKVSVKYTQPKVATMDMLENPENYGLI
jgi:hypothetical protein